MKQIIIAILLTLITINSQSQDAVLSKKDIKIFAQEARYQYLYGNGSFTSICTDALKQKGFNMDQILVIMCNLNINNKEREIIFKRLADTFGNTESVLRQIKSLGIDNQASEYITAYIYDKYLKIANPQ